MKNVSELSTAELHERIMKATTEIIETGLTKNYVPNWTVEQGLKEAMQNIAYGAIKSERPAKIYYDSKIESWAIRDWYKGFGKQYLYIGESEQRDDSEGMGNFGEGWKIFLLVMSRNGIKHSVSTVGFDFWGTLEKTVHGTEVLSINVEENDRKKGTKVYADVSEESWRNAAKSFAYLNGIDKAYISSNVIIPGRRGELYIQGVRIEKDNESNPLKIYYSYNLTQRNLMNRDRSHVDLREAHNAMARIVYEMDSDEVENYINLAVGKEVEHEDIARGPIVPYSDSGGQKEVWLNALAKLHACKKDKLLIASYNQSVNSKAKKKGYSILDTPEKWNFELGYLGIRKADDVIDDQYDIVEVGYHGGSSSKAKTTFSKVLKALCEMFEIKKEDLNIRYAESIANSGNQNEKKAHYDKELGVLFVDVGIADDAEELFSCLIPEVTSMLHNAETSEEFELAYIKILTSIGRSKI